MKAIIYDIEIIKAIPPREGKRLSDVEYCGGWDDHEGMGISVICAYDYNEERLRVFLEDNFDEFQKVIDSTGHIIGFNNIKFDDCVCRANGLDIPSEKSYDLLVAIWKADGLSETYSYPSHAGYGLDACCEANFGIGKTGHGANAPVLWQQGRRGEVIDYCLNDVMLTKRLFERMMDCGFIEHPKVPGGRLSIPTPRWYQVQDIIVEFYEDRR